MNYRTPAQLINTTEVETRDTPAIDFLLLDTRKGLHSPVPISARLGSRDWLWKEVKTVIKRHVDSLPSVLPCSLSEEGGPNGGL